MSAEKPMSGAVGPTEMELRVARVLDSDAFADDEPDYGRAHQSKRAAKAIERARAAIRAMREPTKYMLRVGDRETALDTTILWYAWTAMIDAATHPIQESTTAAVPLK